jgi:hypothetical protein
MPNKGFTRCVFCNKVIVLASCDAKDWIHVATKAMPRRFYGCNYYLSDDKKLDKVMYSFGLCEPLASPTKLKVTI